MRQNVRIVPIAAAACDIDRFPESLQLPYAMQMQQLCRRTLYFRLD